MTHATGNTRQGLLLASLVVLCFACHQASEPKPAQQQASPQTKVESSPEVQPKIEEIPEFEVLLDASPIAIPLQKGGLRFQIDQHPRPNFEYFRPIGEARFNPQGHLLMTFPKKHAVVKFSKPDYELSFFGQEQAGGRNEPISNPQLLSFWNGQTQVVNTKKGQVMVFNEAFEMLDLLQIKIPDPIPGPDSFYLIRSDQKPEIFFKADKNNKIRAQFMVPQNPNQPLPQRRLFFDIQPDWGIVAANQGVTDIFHLKPSGAFHRHLHLRFDPSSPFSQGTHLSSVQRQGDAYWLLLQHENQSYLCEVTIDGMCRTMWQLPFICDGAHLGYDRLVIFNREQGKAQVFKR